MYKTLALSLPLVLIGSILAIRSSAGNEAIAAPQVSVEQVALTTLTPDGPSQAVEEPSPRFDDCEVWCPTAHVYRRCNSTDTTDYWMNCVYGLCPFPGETAIRVWKIDCNGTPYGTDDCYYFRRAVNNLTRSDWVHKYAAGEVLGNICSTTVQCGKCSDCLADPCDD